MATTKLAGTFSVRKPARVSGLRMLDRNRHWNFDSLFRTADPVVIGRVRACNARIQDDTVSKRHCIIERTDDGEYKIIDNDSTNGIYIADNGPYSEYRRVTECVLKIGMHIRLGDVTLTPVDAGGEAPVFIKAMSEFFRRIVNLYGSFREAANHVNPSRETLRHRVNKASRRKARSA